MTAKIDILAIGEPMVEFNEDRSGPAPLYRPGHGGDTSNAIIAAARKTKVDLIVMASHGRRGLKRLLLGSETQQVLTHSSVPVLVLR